MIESGAAPPRVDTFRRVRRGMSRPVFRHFCHARSRVRLYWALSIIAPSVNVLGRTRRKPSTLRGAAPEVFIGQSTAAPAGARPYHQTAGIWSFDHRGGKRFARLSYVDAHEQSPDEKTANWAPAQRVAMK